MGARPERLCEVRRIDEFSRNDQQRVASWNVEAIEELVHDGFGTIGHAVLPQVAGFHPSRDDFEGSASKHRRRTKAAAHRCRAAIPACRRDALPLATPTRRTTERK